MRLNIIFTGSLILIWDSLILLFKAACNFSFSELFPIHFENVAGSLLAGSFNAGLYMLFKRRWIFLTSVHYFSSNSLSSVVFWTKREVGNKSQNFPTLILHSY